MSEIMAFIELSKLLSVKSKSGFPVARNGCQITVPGTFHWEWLRAWNFNDYIEGIFSQRNMEEIICQKENKNHKQRPES